MSWLSQHASELNELEELRLEQLPAELKNGMESGALDDFVQIFAPLARSNADPSAVAQVVRLWWDRWGAQELVAAHKQVALQVKLSPVYARLIERGTDDEWKEFVTMQLRARLGSPSFLSILKRLYST
jgi:hypothetical protein